MTNDVHPSPPAVPNHHGDYPGFAGISGWIAAVSMSRGRDDAAEVAMGLTALAHGDHLVDIGCGPGVAARRAAGRGAVVIGVDPADVMLGVARRADRHHTVTWRRGAAEALPLPDASCGVAWSLSAVHHWPDLDAGLREVRRVLRPGGRFLVTERRVEPGGTGLASHGWVDEQAERFRDLCSSAGFRDPAVTTQQTSQGIVLAVLATPVA